MNEESLTRQLSNPKTGAIVVVVFSTSYGPSLRILEQVKRLIELFPSIQMVPINADEHRHLLSTPALNISEIPAVIMFYQGRPFAGPLTDNYQITDRIRRLAIVSMEVDDFDCVGTNIRLPVSAGLQKWSGSNGLETTNRSPAFLFQPLYSVMDSLYDI